MIYDKSPDIQEVIDASIEVFTEEGVSPKQLFFCLCFFFAVIFNKMTILEKV